MQRLEVSGAVCHIYMYVVRRQRVKLKLTFACRFINLPRKRLQTFRQKNHWKTSHHPARRRRSIDCGLCIVGRFSWRRTQVPIMYTTSLLVTIPINLVIRCRAHALVRRTSVRSFVSAVLTVSISCYTVPLYRAVSESELNFAWSSYLILCCGTVVCSCVMCSTFLLQVGV
jgi:hypothetical protein